MNILIRFALILMLISTNLWSQAPAFTWYTLDAQKKPTINVELFLSSTCPHCHKADDFFKAIESAYPWLRIHRHIINEDKAGLILFNQLLTEQKMDDYAVPSIFFCKSRWRGFASPQTTGQNLLKALSYCKQEIESKGELTDTAVTVLKQQANANKGIEGIPMLSVLRVVLLLALLSLVNTCSIFCLLALLSILFIQKERRDQLLLGGLFILTVAIMHYLQQANIAIFFSLLPWIRIPAVLVGIFLIYLAKKYYKKTLSHSLLYLATFLLALMIGSYQQLCSTNWSYFFEQWLAQQPFNLGQKVLYAIMYQILYFLPLVLVLLFYFFLINIKRLQGFKKGLKPVGLLFILAFGLMLIVYPLALSSLKLSYLLLILVPICAVFLHWFNKRRNP